MKVEREDAGGGEVLAALVLAVAFATPGIATAQPKCPSSQLTLSTSTVFTTSAASLDTSYLLNRVRYDLVTGARTGPTSASRGNIAPRRRVGRNLFGARIVNSQLPTSNSQVGLFEETRLGNWKLGVGSYRARLTRAGRAGT